MRKDTKSLETADARKARMAELGRRGGQSTFARYGSAHMSAIGKAGFQALATFARGGRMTALRKLAAAGRITPRYPKPDLTEEETKKLYEDVGLE